MKAVLSKELCHSGNWRMVVAAYEFCGAIATLCYGFSLSLRIIGRQEESEDRFSDSCT